MARRRRRRTATLGATSKRDYIAIGTILCRNGASPGLVREMADYFSSDNPAFRPSAFIAQAGKCRR